MEIVEFFASGNKEYWLNQIKRSDWSAGQYLYELIRDDRLRELCGEKTRVLLLTDGEKLVSFCTYAEQDDIRKSSLTPWVGFVYTFPEFRGKRRMGILLERAYALAKADGYEYIYISTGETGLYEKYGYSFWKIMKDINGGDSRVYRKDVIAEKLSVITAGIELVPVIEEIVSATIKEIYPKYYLKEVVDFFLDLHNAANIEKDVLEKKTYVICSGDSPVGTGTIDGNHITRLFVRPGYQGRGIGSALMDYLEAAVIRDYGSVLIDSSLPSGEFYRKRRYVQIEHREHPAANGKILSYEVMRKRIFSIDPEMYNAPARLVRKEMELQGIDFDELKEKIPHRVYLLADSLYDTMIERNVGTLAYHIGGELYVMNHNDRIGFARDEMCSPGIAVQAEDLFAAGVQELVHVGFAGGRGDTRVGDYVITDGAYHDTSVVGLYGFDDEIIETSRELTESLCREMKEHGLEFLRGYHWTTDAGYVETDWYIRYFEEKGVKCVEMEGAGLFTAARFRSRRAAGIYVISDSGSGEEWDLGWGEDPLEQSIRNLIDAIIE